MIIRAKKVFVSLSKNSDEEGKTIPIAKRNKTENKKKKTKKIFFVKLFALHANVVTSKRSDQIVSYIIA